MNSRLDYTTSSRVLHNGPAVLLAVTVAGDGADADAQVYDGLDTNGRQIMHIEAAEGQTAHIVLPEDIRLETGLYIAVNASTTKVTVQHAPLAK